MGFSRQVPGIPLRSSTHELTEDVVYAEVEGFPLRYDHYRPLPATGPAPAVVVVHGGGWMNGDPSQAAGNALHFARQGIATISIAYRLAPAHRFPAPLDDVRRGLRHVRRNADVRAGDALILTKAIGVGIYSAAIKKGALPPDGYTEMIGTTTLLNRIGAELAQDKDVHAITDVTGFGLLGHASEMARGSNMTVAIQANAVPLLSSAAKLAQDGFVTGASHRNWASYGAGVTLPEGMPEWRRHLLTDPQTSGGLLVACAPGRAEAIAAPSGRTMGVPADAMKAAAPSSKWRRRCLSTRFMPSGVACGLFSSALTKSTKSVPGVILPPLVL